MPQFVPNLELNAALYAEVVAPLLGGRVHSAALLGWGSEVLGLDTSRSTDHGWGPRLQIFVEEHDVDSLRQLIDEALPESFRGWPTRYGWDSTPVSHHVEVVPLGAWLERWIGLDPRGGMRPMDWLLVPQQHLLGVVRGAVFHDPCGELGSLRRALEWYPEDVWRWLVGCQWRRIAQEEAFVGRAAEVGDDLGSRLVAARLARDLMRLCFLLARQYWPYSKWLGTSFSRLADDDGLSAALTSVVDASDYVSREDALVASYEAVARRHNRSGITEPVDPRVRQFYGRPFRVLMADRFVDACLAQITDPWLRSLPLVGSVDQVADSTDVLAFAERSRRLRRLYQSD